MYTLTPRIQYTYYHIRFFELEAIASKRPHGIVEFQHEGCAYYYYAEDNGIPTAVFDTSMRPVKFKRNTIVHLEQYWINGAPL